MVDGESGVGGQAGQALEQSVGAGGDRSRHRFADRAVVDGVGHRVGGGSCVEVDDEVEIELDGLGHGTLGLGYADVAHHT